MKIYAPNVPRRVTQTILDINYCYLMASRGSEQSTVHPISELLLRSVFQSTVVPIRANYLDFASSVLHPNPCIYVMSLKINSDHFRTQSCLVLQLRQCLLRGTYKTNSCIKRGQTACLKRPCQSAGVWSPAYHRGGPGSITGQPCHICGGQMALGQVPHPQYFASPYQYRSTNAPHSSPLQYNTYQKDNQAKFHTMNFYRIFVSNGQKSTSTLF